MLLLMFLPLKSKKPIKPLAENYNRTHKWDNASIPADFSYSEKIQQVTDPNNVECVRLGKAMTGYDVIRFITEPITWG